MKRVTIAARADYTKKLDDLSFKFHSLNNIYWDESAMYQFSMDEILKMEAATNEVYQMCLKAVQHVIDNDLYSEFNIDPILIDSIVESWNEEHFSVYGRFDFGYDGENFKLFEFNADTPTSLYEAAVVQWYWLQDIDKSKDQWNSIHEKLIDYWNSIRGYLNGKILYFSCVKDSIEDFTTVEYLRDTAHQSGLNTKFIYISDIGFNGESFVDLENCPIDYVFKLYPYEWMANEEFAPNLDKAVWIEPAWKAILSNKNILPLLWELNKGHKNLLECYKDSPKGLTKYAKKPIYSREGANIEIITNGNTVQQTSGDYGEEGYIYQELFNLPNFDNNYPIIGSWMIGGEAAGMGIREANTLITDNLSRFVPHLIIN